MIRRFRARLSFTDILGGMTDRSGSIEVLEETFQAKFGYPHAVYFPSPKSASRAFLECLGERRPEVVCSAYQPSTLIESVKLAGRTPLYVDTDGHFNADSVQFRAALASSQAGCGIVTSIYGTDLDESFSRSFDKPVLYDFSSRILAPGRLELKPTDAVIFSLNWDMPFTTICGGMLCAASRAHAIQWREWRDQQEYRESNWRSWIQAVQAYLSATAAFRSEQYPGAWAYALGTRQLGDLDHLRQERRAQVARYHQAFKRMGGLVQLPKGGWLSHFPIRLATKRYGVTFGDTGHADLGPLPQLPCDLPHLAGRRWREPENARALLKDTLLLPLYAGLGESEQKRVVTHITRWADAPALPGQSIPCYVPSR